MARRITRNELHHWLQAEGRAAIYYMIVATKGANKNANECIGNQLDQRGWVKLAEGQYSGMRGVYAKAFAGNTQGEILQAVGQDLDESKQSIFAILSANYRKDPLIAPEYHAIVAKAELYDNDVIALMQLPMYAE